MPSILARASSFAGSRALRPPAGRTKDFYYLPISYIEAYQLLP